MYSKTCLNRSCSKAETVLRRTGTFDPICSLYAFLSRISKAKNCKEDTASYGEHFQSSVKKRTTCLTRAQQFQEFPRNTELNWTFLSIFSKRNIFLHFKAAFFYFNLKFWRSATLLTRTRHLLFQVALCNQPTIVFAPLKAILTFKPYCTSLWTTGFSTVTYIKLWWSVKDVQKNALKMQTHSTVDILTGMFLLPKSSSLMSLVSFPGNPL